MTFVVRSRRQRDTPASKGKFCDWCPCANCQGDEEPPFKTSSILLADGTRMCDVCRFYPPCGVKDDCEEFKSTGDCSHRPKADKDAVWVDFKEWKKTNI